MKREKVLVLDFGSQFSMLILKRIRSSGVYSELVPFNIPASKLKAREIKAIVLSGGPSFVNDKTAPKPHPDIYRIGKPILGICYGLQVIAKQFGGKIEHGDKREYGQASISLKKDRLWLNIKNHSTVWMSHYDQVTELPEDFESIASTKTCKNAAVKHNKLPIYGLQFHPEVVHTEHGTEIIKNFLRTSDLSFNWLPANFLRETIDSVKSEVKEENVLCGLSGGVDSTVLAAILHKAIGKRLQCFFIDNGLLRLNEAEEVMKNVKSLSLPVNLIDARKFFLKNLKGIIDPEEKRKIIGKIFIRTFERAQKKYTNFKYLAQGTLYPDVVESASVKGPASVIKSHHNVGGLPEKFRFKLLEPFRELFKDEVRALGKELKIPDYILGRHPFPGPGLAVRIIGDVNKENIDLLRKADAIFIDELKSNNLYDYVWQAFAVLLPVRSVGVMGDSRTYEQVIALRAVMAEDGMTADWAPLPNEFLGKVANRIINEIHGINRVVYDLSSKPPATIEWE
ncbi:MAG: glutamine-hydrolyzing GMP synthase [Candidatus Coatesbacteria bacterium]|nr:glutamine-hydrolyzing GMP synthase [Candidatus Coatesbacteria bacterium]